MHYSDKVYLDLITIYNGKDLMHMDDSKKNQKTWLKSIRLKNTCMYVTFILIVLGCEDQSSNETNNNVNPEINDMQMANPSGQTVAMTLDLSVPDMQVLSMSDAILSLDQSIVDQNMQAVFLIFSSVAKLTGKKALPLNCTCICG